MDLIYALALLSIPLLIAARFQWRDRGWAMGWCVLFALAGGFRLLMEVLPRYAPEASWIFTLVCAGYLLREKLPSFQKNQILRALPWVACAALLLVRSYFPQFDIDSMDYHISAIQWLKDRTTLPELYQHAEVIKSWYWVVGFEEWLSIPGLAGDLGLTAGLVGGVLKTLGLCTLISLLPATWPLLRYLAAFLLLIDDHFFFSGQSRYVYLNPSLIPLTALMLHLTWRGIRGSSQRLWMGVALAGGMASVKYLGLYFLPIPVLALFITRPKHLPDKTSRWALAAALLLGGSVFGLHFLSTGNPVVPVPNRFFELKAFHRGTEVFLHYFMQESFWQACAQPLRRLVYPGNLAMKMVAVCIIPTFALSLLLLYPRFKYRFWILKRRLFFALLCFGVVQGWAIIAHYIASIEKSRYPRYVMGIAILGLLSLLIAMRKKILPQGHWKWGEPILGWGLLIFLVVTLDTRFYNIAPPQRPSWSHIGAFIQAKFRGTKNSLEFEAPFLKDLLLHEVQTDFPPLRKRLLELEAQTGLQLLRGEGLACHGGFGTWPNILLAPNMMILSIPEGGGYLRFPKGVEALQQAGLRYLILPPEFVSGGEKGPYVRRGDGQLEPLLFDEKALFKGQFLKLVRVQY